MSTPDQKVADDISAEYELRLLRANNRLKDLQALNIAAEIAAVQTEIAVIQAELARLSPRKSPPAQSSDSKGG